MTNPLLKPFRDKELFPIIYNVSYFYWGNWQDKKYFSSFKDKTPVNCFVTMGKNKSLGFLNSDKLAEISKEFFADFFRRPSILLKKQQELAVSQKKINSIYRRYTLEYLEKQEISNLLPLIKKVKDISWHSNGRIWFCVYPLSADFFSSYFDIKKIWDKATIPIGDSFDKIQRLSILRLLADEVAWPDIVESCQYFYSSYHHSLSLEEVEKKLRIDGYPLTANQARKELKKEEKIKIQKEKKFLVWKKTLSAPERKIVNYIQAVIEFRDCRKDIFNKSFVIMYRIASKAFRQAGISTELIPFVEVSEIIRGVKYLKKIKKDLENRKKGSFIYYPYAGRERQGFVDYNKLKKETLNLYQQVSNLESLDSIKGQCGAPGKVTGKIRVIIYQRDFKNFKKGEILVSGMTRPEFMPLMQRAKGIITDEGGITCHAAIVSRELKLPCVIGTKVATQILKDGDIVEINAFSGIVKVVKRK